MYQSLSNLHKYKNERRNSSLNDPDAIETENDDAILSLLPMTVGERYSTYENKESIIVEDKRYCEIGGC